MSDRDDTALPPAPIAPKERGGPKVNLRWRQDFLEAYEACGGFYASAKTAGVNSTTVYDERHRDPVFNTACEEAKQRFADSRVASLTKIGDNGNPVGDIVLLKALRPNEYIEKTVSLSLTATTELPAEDGRQLLLAMFGQGHPAQIPERSETP